jgi:putative methionine-R-sulfoxide reductase with GAF domain
MLASLRPARGATREALMRQAVDAFWEALGSEVPGARGVSWIGFYIKVEGQDEMVLAERRDKPACSPIGMHGMCGRGWQDRRPILIANVRTLGPNYIACDPKDQSELVIPCFNADGSCWGVLDADSYDLDAFDDRDVASLTAAIEQLGLSVPPRERPTTLRL